MIEDVSHMDADGGIDEDAGGDPVCWISRVCTECGALLENVDAPCWRCGAVPGTAGLGA